MEVALKNNKPGLMTGQLPLPLVPIDTIPIGDAAGVYEQLTFTKTCYPETNLPKRFSDKDRPGIS